jgi:MATE family multidrug resistance protein
LWLRTTKERLDFGIRSKLFRERPHAGRRLAVNHALDPSRHLAFTHRPIAEVLQIALPTALTMLSYPLMQFVDKLMVGQVGPLEVAAQGNGGIWAFAPMSVGMGLITVVNTYVSQNLGAGTPRNGPKYAWAAVWLSAGIWLLLLAWAAMLPWLFTALGHRELPDGERLYQMELSYAWTLLAGSILVIAGRGLHHFFFGLHRPGVVFLATVVGNVVNILANYVLIFGERGLPALDLPGIPETPALGVLGAALGTVLGTAFELGIPLFIFLGRKLNDQLGTRAAWRLDLRAAKDILRLGWPGGFQFGNEMICWAIFMTGLVAVFGPDHLTAAWIVLTYMHLSFMPAVGFAVATTSLVGKYIGAGLPDEAVRRARIALALAVAYTSFWGLMFLLFRHELVAIFLGGDATPQQAAEIIRIGGVLMICAAVFQAFDAIGIVYAGALRGAGDTIWPGIVTMLYSWTLIIGLGWLLVRFAPGLESLGPWIGSAVYIIMVGITLAWRFERGHWRSIRLLESAAGAEPGVDSLRRAAAQLAPIGPAPPGADGEAPARDEAEEIAASVAASEASRQKR